MARGTGTPDSRPAAGGAIGSAIGVAALVACLAAPGVRAQDGARIAAADKEPQNWLSHGRTYSEQRFSPLARINTSNIGQLGLTWFKDINSRTARGLEATPIVMDGVIYATGAWSHVLAIEAKTGKTLWEFDPEIAGRYAGKGCCDIVNRGVAAWNGKIFVGRLIALDAKTGKKVWETLTVDQSMDYTITGAPRVVKGKIIIGNGGAEYGVCGYVSAYDAETGKMLWDFHAQTGIVAAPVTYEVDGEQYVTVLAGWGGAIPLLAGELALDAAKGGTNRVLTFKLGAKAELPMMKVMARKLEPPQAAAPKDVVDKGRAHYQQFCAGCHGDTAASGGVVLDLRYSATLGDAGAWKAIVLEGARLKNGMVTSEKYLKPDEVDQIRAYVIQRAHDEKKRVEAAK